MNRGNAPTSSSTDVSHDVPLSDRQADDYNRWPIATAISAVIDSAPQGWATRIAVYGRWGDGKTTILNFVASQQHARSNVVVRFASWLAGSETELWLSFSKALRAQLKKSGLHFGWLSAVWFWLRCRAVFLPGLLKGTNAAVEQAYQVGIPSAVIDAASAGLTKLLSFSRSDAEKLRTYVTDRRIVVFIDDLDRADPSLVPKLLLTLRELLDLPQFVFVLAFDREVITRALERYNSAWGPEGAFFLEKIIDFPFELTTPTPDQVRMLAIRQFKGVCPFVPVSTIEDLYALFPRNPRRLKLFARIISSLGTEARRHGEGELNWNVIFLYNLLALEDLRFAKAFFARILDQNDFSWANWLFSREVAKEEQKKLDEFIDVDYKHLSADTRGRLRTLVNAWKDRGRQIMGVALEYQISFAMNPHHITWSEFKTFLAEWRAGRSEKVIHDFVQRRAKAITSSVESASTELMDTILTHYGNVLEKASETRIDAEHAALIQEGKETLNLFEGLYFKDLEWLPASYFQKPRIWGILVSRAWTWAGFRKNPGEEELRQYEEKLLVRAAEKSIDPVGFYTALEPWKRDDPEFDPETPKFRRELGRKLNDALSKSTIGVVLEVFKRPDLASSLYPAEEHHAFQYLLGAPESPLYEEPHLAALEDVIRTGAGALEIQKNTKDYLSLLLTALNHNGYFCQRNDRIAFLKKHEELIRVVWETLIAFRVQYRFVQSIEKIRTSLIQAGVNEVSLRRPDWLPAPQTQEAPQEHIEEGGTG